MNIFKKIFGGFKKVNTPQNSGDYNRKIANAEFDNKQEFIFKSIISDMEIKNRISQDFYFSLHVATFVNYCSKSEGNYGLRVYKSTVKNSETKFEGTVSDTQTNKELIKFNNYYSELLYNKIEKRFREIRLEEKQEELKEIESLIEKKFGKMKDF